MNKGSVISLGAVVPGADISIKVDHHCFDYTVKASDSIASTLTALSEKINASFTAASSATFAAGLTDKGALQVISTKGWPLGVSASSNSPSVLLSVVPV